MPVIFPKDEQILKRLSYNSSTVIAKSDDLNTNAHKGREDGYSKLLLVDFTKLKMTSPPLLLIFQNFLQDKRLRTNKNGCYTLLIIGIKQQYQFFPYFFLVAGRPKLVCTDLPVDTWKTSLSLPIKRPSPFALSTNNIRYHLNISWTVWDWTASKFCHLP